jgi:hypothetical protein
LWVRFDEAGGGAALAHDFGRLSLGLLLGFPELEKEPNLRQFILAVA